MQIVTQTLLNLGIDEGKEINESQLVLLGLKENENLNWKENSLGITLSDARAELFVLLNGVSDKEIQEKIIFNYKALQKFRLGQQPLDQVRLKSRITKEDNIAEKKAQEIISVSGDIIIYCDGGCTPNPGKAGSGVAVYRNNKISELWYGLYEEMGTNNTAELGALYEALLLAQKEVERGNNVEIKCDSMYSINCIQTWAISWEKKDWTKKGGEIKNLEIIKLAYYLYNKIKKDITLSHIKAHAGFEGNELADRMTMYAIQEKSEFFVQYAQNIDVAEILRMRVG